MASAKHPAEWNGDIKKSASKQERVPHLMEVRISSFSRGVEVYKDVQLVRVKNATNNLLILEDHMPVMGELDGSLTFVSRKEEYTLENIQGFFTHSHNLFEMLIREGRV